jgi:hypothetical protein
MNRILDKYLKSSCQATVFAGSVGSKPFPAALCRRFHDREAALLCVGVAAEPICRSATCLDFLNSDSGSEE